MISRKKDRKPLPEHQPDFLHIVQSICLIEFLISSDEIVLPMVKGGNPMSEMILK